MRVNIVWVTTAGVDLPQNKLNTEGTTRGFRRRNLPMEVSGRINKWSCWLAVVAEGLVAGNTQLYFN